MILMAVGLYTSRVVLNSLGIDDYGIYNVVGGFVVTFSFLSLSMTNASSRYMSTAIGKSNFDLISHTFNVVVTIHLILASVILILCETIGLWFVLNKMIIPTDRAVAAFWVYQFSVVSFIVSIVYVPFNSLIVSHERMNAFAYISIFDSFAKLGVAFLVGFYSSAQALVLYGGLISLVHIASGSLYFIYSYNNFKEARFHLIWDKKLSLEILKFSAWTMNGNLAVIGYTQGINVLLNLFFGPAVNAARGIAVQVQAAIRQFFMSFQTALNPQIIKSYARNDLTYMHKLIIIGSKGSYYLVLLLAIPIYFNTDYILSIWLTKIPDYTVTFVQIMLCVCLINTQGNLLGYSVHATGNLKKFQLVEGGILLLVVPVAYILLKWCNINPNQVFLTYLIIECLAQFSRVIIVCPMINFPIKEYLKHIVAKITVVTFLALVFPLIYRYVFGISGFLQFILFTLFSLIFTSIVIWSFGMSHNERKIITSKIFKLNKVRSGHD